MPVGVVADGFVLSAVPFEDVVAPVVGEDVVAAPVGFPPVDELEAAPVGVAPVDELEGAPEEVVEQPTEGGRSVTPPVKQIFSANCTAAF